VLCAIMWTLLEGWDCQCECIVNRDRCVELMASARVRRMADGKPAGTRFKTMAIYMARAGGDTCIESDSRATRRGEAMGKLLGESLLAAHVVRIESARG
jgi:hypothetical protein